MGNICGRRQPSPCCPAGSYGPFTDVSSTERRGKYEDLSASLTAYVVGPATAKSGVIVCSDIFGFDTGRHMEYCDMIAERCNCIVVCPDFFHGQAPRLEKPIIGFCGMLTNFLPRLPRMISNIKNTQWEAIRVDLSATIQFLRSRGVTKAASIGFCWGAYPVWRAGGDPEFSPEFLVCGVSAHPSMHNCPKMAKDPLGPNDIVAQVRCPQLVLASKSEPPSWKPGGEVESIVRGLSGPVSDGSEFRVFAERDHGWVIRGDFSKPGVAEDASAAISASMEFMNKYF